MTIFVVLAVLFLLLASGLAVGFSLLSAGIVGLLILGKPLSTVVHVTFQTIDNFVFVAVPLFIFMSEVLLRGKIGDDLFDFINMFLGKIKGGLAVSTILSCGFFAAVTGSSTANTATIGMVSIPALIKRKYDKNFVYGTIAAGGATGILIPPSIPLIIFGGVTDTSIGKLFMAGVIPGIIDIILLSAYALYKSRKMKDIELLGHTPWKERFKMIPYLTPAALLPVLVLGVIYTGVCTPTESAGIGVTYAIILSVCIYKRIKLKDLIPCLLNTVKVTTMIFTIVMGAMIFGYVMAILQMPQMVLEAFLRFQVSQMSFLFIMSGIYFVLGMFLDPVSVIMLTLPIIHPTLIRLDINLLWYAIVLVENMEVANLTPPVGLNLYVVKGVANDSLENVIKGSAPYVLVLMVAVVIAVLFPPLSTWLPQFVN